MGDGLNPPVVWDAEERFDFTLVFELSIFSILLSAIFLLVALLHVNRLRRSSRVINGRLLQCIKSSAIAIDAALQAALVALWRGSNHKDAQLGIAAAFLALVASTISIPLSWLQHERALRPSSALISFFSLAALGHVFHVRTLWMQRFSTPFVGVAIASCITKAIIASLESVEKRRFLRASGTALSPGDLCSFWNRALYVWVNPIFLKGFQQVLSLGDLHPLQEALHAGPLQSQFNHGRGNDLPSGRFSLALTLVSSLGLELLYPVPARMLLIGFTFCQPLLIKSILSYLEQNVSAFPQDTDNFILIGMAFAYLGIAVCGSLYSYLIVCLLAKVRAILVSSIYRKVMELPPTANNKAAVTLMSTDVERITAGLRSLHDIWAEVAEVGIAIWLLERELGVGAVGPVILAIFCFLAALGVNKFTMARQNTWMKALAKRVSATASVLSSMKGVKMIGLSDYVTDLITSLRVGELTSAKGFRTIMASTFCIAFTPKYLSPALCFGIYLGVVQRGGVESFDASKAFTSLSIVILLTSPLSSLFQYLTPLLGALNCLERIQDFLRSSAHSDPRSRLVDKGLNEKQISTEASKKSDLKDHFETLEVDKDNVFEIRDGKIGWNPKTPVLSNVDVSIPRGKLTMVVGPVASGKSTLCKTFLGEVPEFSGSISTSCLGEGIGYCDQTSYLINGTVKQNIVGYSPWNKPWYQTVIKVMTLLQELKLLPLGDETMVGSNGAALSTGQRQRVAVARAVYARLSTIILDDVFSGMDNITKCLIFDGLFGANGILRHSNTTVVMVTHDKAFLKAADHVILLQQGAPPVSTMPEETLSQWEPIEPENADSSEETTDDTSTETKSPAKADKKEKPRNMSDWRVYKYYAQALNTINVVIMLSLGVSFAFLYTFPSIWISWWTENPGKRDNFYMGIYAMLQGVGLLLWFCFTYHILTTSITASGLSLHARLLKTVMSAPMPFLTKKDTGSVLNKFSQDLEIIDGELPGALLNTLATALIAFSQVAIITTASPWIAITYPLLFLVFYAIQKFYLRTSQQLRPMDLELKSPLYSHFLDSMRGISTIRAFGWCQQHVEHNDVLLDTSQRPAFLLSMVQQWLGLVLKLVILGLAVTLTALALKLRSMTGFTGVALVNLMSLNEMMMSVVYGWMLLETSISAVCRVKEFEEQTPSETDESSETEEEVNGQWPYAGGVECRALKASYGPDEKAMALKGLNLTVEPGEKVGICGRSGSGKSSLLASMFRMLDIREGELLIDSVDIKSVSLKSLRSRINAIPQDPFFVPGTVRENLDPLGTASTDSMQLVLEKTSLWKKIEEIGGLGADLEPESLSQGQKQLFSLARALLRERCAIVVMDEVTSSLDSDTEDLMMRTLQQAFEGCTIIAIAHRLDTILGFDRVAVFSDGMVVECDDPKMLLGQSDSALSKLVAAGRT